jgi:hypothetical protein
MTMKKAPMLDLVGGAGTAPARPWDDDDDELGFYTPEFVAALSDEQIVAHLNSAICDLGEMHIQTRTLNRACKQRGMNVVSFAAKAR